MANNLAMYIRPPSINLGDTMRTAAALRGANIANDSGALQLQQAQQSAGALDQYRMAARSGDPNAMNTLTGYPELQGQVMDAMSHLDEAQQRQAIQRGQKVGRAAASVLALPRDSDERKAEWNKQLDGLKKDGILTQDQYDEYHDNPSDLALHNALTLGMTYDQVLANLDKQQQGIRDQNARDILLGTAPQVVRQEEGFRAKPYDDGGTLRIGYGSDTITKADGTVEKVTKNTVITKEDAERDLQRRLPEFANKAADQVGTATWAGFDDPTKAALSSVAYNYGSLPDEVRDAARSGDKERIAKAVEGLDANPARRAREAAMIRGQSLPTGTQPEGTQPSYRDRLITVASDPNVSDSLRDLATTLLKDEKKTPKSYDELSADDKLQIEDAARKQVEAGQSKYAMDNVPPEELQKQIDAARESIKNTLFGENEQNVQRLLPTEEEIGAGPEAFLIAHPELASEYDAKYGKGAAAKVLKKGG